MITWKRSSLVMLESEALKGALEILWMNEFIFFNCLFDAWKPKCG